MIKSHGKTPIFNSYITLPEGNMISHENLISTIHPEPGWSVLGTSTTSPTILEVSVRSSSILGPSKRGIATNRVQWMDWREFQRKLPGNWLVAPNMFGFQPSMFSSSTSWIEANAFKEYCPVLMWFPSSAVEIPVYSSRVNRVIYVVLLVVGIGHCSNGAGAKLHLCLMFGLNKSGQSRISRLVPSGKLTIYSWKLP